MRKFYLPFILFISVACWLSACQKDSEVKDEVPPTPVDTTKPFKATPYPLALPPGWPSMFIPADNPLTMEGVELGRKLFYDPILSQTNTMSCGTCHNIAFGFTDNGKQFSEGLKGEKGTRNSMPLFNLGWSEKYITTNHKFFWDGGAADLESQVLGPITNPIEMNETLANVVQKLQQHSVYPGLFKKAFGTDSVTTKRLIQAIAQFERTIISFGSRYDMYMVTKNRNLLTDQEWRGFELFNNDVADGGADCFHCHNLSSPFTSDFQFHHNGHQSADEGLKRITGNPEDIGKFRTPSLRNLVFTAPYMHDGRLKTLEEVVEFYNSGAIRVFPADELIRKNPAGLNLTPQKKADLVAFLKTLTDSTLLTKTHLMAP
jgi:cytochrome c peroxidase